MPTERLSMRKIKEVLRLKHDCRLSNRQIAHSCRVARSSVADYLRRAGSAGLAWSAAQGLSEEELGARLFPAAADPASQVRPLPDCEHIYNELRRHRDLNLTLAQLWQEYQEQHKDQSPYQYTQYCEYYQRWRGKLDYCMRQDHKSGEKLFVDYGDGLSIVNPKTGELIETQLFVGVWGASNFTYAEASLTQELPSWIGSHVRAFEYFGCVPHVLVPDNLKSGVNRACFYEPELNVTYADLAQHYGAAVLPTRPRHPRDKAKVEAGVLVAKRWILAVLRHRTFYSLAELNVAIRELLGRLNARLLRKMKKSRRELFETLDRPNAKPLPDKPYEYAEWRKARVNLDYHVEVEQHYYSVPFQLLHEQLDIRLSATTLEAFHKGGRVAAHARSYVKHGHTTLKEHMPPEHQKYLEWTPTRIIDWAAKTGPATALLVEKIMTGRAHPEQGYRACLGILRRLAPHFGAERVEAASRRALTYGTCSYKSMHAILNAGLDKLDQPAEQPALPLHENIRGGEYYH